MAEKAKHYQKQWVRLAEHIARLEFYNWIRSEWGKGGAILKKIKRLYPNHPRRPRLQRQWNLIGARVAREKYLLRLQ